MPVVSEQNRPEPEAALLLLIAKKTREKSTKPGEYYAEIAQQESDLHSSSSDLKVKEEVYNRYGILMPITSLFVVDKMITHLINDVLFICLPCLE